MVPQVGVDNRYEKMVRYSELYTQYGIVLRRVHAPITNEMVVLNKDA